MVANSNFGTGRYVAAESDILWTPRGYTGGVRGVIYVHGAGELASSVILGSTNGKTNESALLAAIASVYPVLAVDAGVFGANNTTDSNSWGNPNAVTRIGQAITWLQSPIGAGGLQNPAGGGAKAGPVILVGISMGHVTSLNYAQQNPTKVAGIVGVLPLNDLDNLRDNNNPIVISGGGRLSIERAWGIGAWTAPGTPPLPAGANPALPANQTNLKNIPQLNFAAFDDTVCPFSTALALTTNMPIAQLVNMGNCGGHSDGSVGVASIVQILQFLSRFP
jgi:pimeloyl-ACP methyl ester carboxylesterase